MLEVVLNGYSRCVLGHGWNHSNRYWFDWTIISFMSLQITIFDSIYLGIFECEAHILQALLSLLKLRHLFGEVEILSTMIYQIIIILFLTISIRIKG